MISRIMRVLFYKKQQAKTPALTEEEALDFEKSRNSLKEANANLQKTIEDNHFTLNIRKAIEK